MPVRPLRGRAIRLFTIAALLASPLMAAVVAPTPASAGATYNLLKTNNFPSSEPQGWSTCQHKYVTLPKLSSSDRYAWAEDFPQERSAFLVNYHQTFHGKFYWTVCVVSMKGNPNSSAYAYYEYSLLTGYTSACENQGHCTTYELSSYYIWTGENNILWGSQIFVVPSDYCAPLQDGTSSCEETAGVSVSTS